MRVNSSSIFVGDDRLEVRHGKREELSTAVSSHNSINGKALKQKLDPIANKKEQAQKRAVRLMSDAFKSEKRIDTEIANRRNNISSLIKDKEEAAHSIEEFETERAGLKEQYNVSENSIEQKDLELLEKEMKSRFEGSGVSLTKEDREALAELKDRLEKNGGLTEYQSRSLEKLSYEENDYRTIAEAEAQIKLDTQVINSIEVERAKNDPVRAAQRKGDAIKEAANEQIVGMLADEAKAYIDEVAQEKQEQAQEKKEKKEELEKRIDAVKERKEENEKLTENILEGTEIADAIESGVNSAQQELKVMMNKMKLIEDDIKGAAVDTSL